MVTRVGILTPTAAAYAPYEKASAAPGPAATACFRAAMAARATRPPYLFSGGWVVGESV